MEIRDRIATIQTTVLLRLAKNSKETYCQLDSSRRSPNKIDVKSSKAVK